MIGNYIDIDYEKLPKRKTEESPKTEEKDYSSIKKLLNHPQYKDIIGLYRGNSEAKPVMDITQSSRLESYNDGGFGRGALPLSTGALPIIGGAMATTGAALRGSVKGPKFNAFRVPSKDEKKPVLDDVKGNLKPEDLPEGVESSKPVEVDNGIEDDLESTKQPLLQLLDDLGLSPEDAEILLDILDKGVADLGDDDSINLPENVQTFKLPPEFKKRVFDDIVKRYPDLGVKIVSNDPEGKKAWDDLWNLIEKYMEAKKFHLDRDAHKFNEEDELAERKRVASKYDKRMGSTEYVPREDLDEEINKKDASMSITREVSRSNKEESIPESNIMGGSKGKAKEDAKAKFKRLQQGNEFDTGEPKDKPASWQTKPGPWD